MSSSPEIEEWWIRSPMLELVPKWHQLGPSSQSGHTLSLHGAMMRTTWTWSGASGVVIVVLVGRHLHKREMEGVPWLPTRGSHSCTLSLSASIRSRPSNRVSKVRGNFRLAVLDGRALPIASPCHHEDF